MPETKAYPETITADMLPQWAHIPDEELARDIADTELEIAGYRALHVAEQTIATVHPNETERDLAEFRSRARPVQISQREAFVAFLRRVQDARKAATA